MGTRLICLPMLQRAIFGANLAIEILWLKASISILKCF